MGLVAGSLPPSRLLWQRVGFAFLLLCTLLIVVPIIALLMKIIISGAPAISWEFLSQPPSQAGKAGGIFPAIVGTLYLMVGTVVFSLPVGVLAAVYLAEYAGQNWVTRLINLAIVNLAGVPSIVYGLFGLGVFVLTFGFGMSLLAASLTLACQALAVVITASREALLAVPQEYREASLALAATKWQTVRHAVLPQALPGIVTGAVLAMSRAAGETAPILVVGAAFFLPALPHSPFDQFMALPYHLYTVAAHIPGVPKQTMWGVALVLVAVVLSFNSVAILLRWRARRRKIG
ncbi:MAG TPA: phosphate ABC transporter permease PstA [Dehalococcoidia bacterium]|nr:phosphate ABC transporter permease PstA [Dehalococcoidia bacterium]